VPRVLVQRFRVPAEAMDVNGHVNNLAYLQWMQDAAIAHSAAQGWPLERYLATGTGWVVRSHFIEYLLPAFADEELCLLTWVAGLQRKTSPRKFLFWREEDRQVLARAETLWVFVESATGRPVRIPPELLTAFEVVPPDEDVLDRCRAGGALGPLPTEGAQ
jgi:acyl-CoA thioester hydrolase